MRRSNELPSRRTIYAIAGMIVVLAIGLATVTHAHERDDRPERPERPEHPLNGVVDIAAKLNLLSNLKIVVNNDNNVNVHGATVTATSTSGFTATTVTPPLTFIVQTDASTKFNFKGMGNGTLADLAIGDTVNFRGVALSGTTTSTWTVQATHVEDKTMHPKPPKPPKPPVGPLSLKGEVQSVSTTAGTFVMFGGNGTTTVSVSGSTTIKDEDGNTLTLAGITAGSEVKAHGTMSTSTNIFVATRVVVDLDDDGIDPPNRPDLSGLIARLEALLNWLKSNPFLFQVR